MKNACVGFAVLLAFILSCAPSQQVTSFWKNADEFGKKQYSSVFIMALTSDRGARNVIETDLAAAASAKGIKATKSIDFFPGTFTQESAPSKEELLGKIKELKCDAIFTMSLIDEKSEQRYVPGTTTYAASYAPYPYYGYYGGFYGYYSYMYPVVSTSGYYTTDKTYFIEANLYDAETEQIHWSMQSSAYNPSSLSSFSKEYAKMLITRLEAERAQVK